MGGDRSRSRPGTCGGRTRTDAEAPTVKTFYDLTRIQPHSIVHLGLFEVTQVSLGLAWENVVTRTQSHPFRHAVCACARPVCIASSDSASVNSLNEGIASLFLAEIGRQVGDVRKEKGEESRRNQIVELKRRFVCVAPGGRRKGKKSQLFVFDKGIVSLLVHSICLSSRRL